MSVIFAAYKPVQLFKDFFLFFFSKFVGCGLYIWVHFLIQNLQCDFTLIQGHSDTRKEKLQS